MYLDIMGVVYIYFVFNVSGIIELCGFRRDGFFIGYVCDVGVEGGRSMYMWMYD